MKIESGTVAVGSERWDKATQFYFSQSSYDLIGHHSICLKDLFLFLSLKSMDVLDGLHTLVHTFPP